MTLAACDANAKDPFLRRTPTVEVVEAAGPSVVNITTVRIEQNQPFSGFSGNPFFDRFFRDFPAPRGPQSQRSLGSGVVIDENHHVVTNAHVIAHAEEIRVTIGDGREFEATLVGADPNNDLAVLKLETEEQVPWIPAGTSDNVLVGEPVIAIGNPFGLSNTVTTGVLSAVNRSIRAEDRVFHGFLQTDASINPGNSGGPLLNANGELIGINTAIYGGAQGIGFAIPIDAAKRVVKELITHGAIAPVWLGLDVQDINEDMATLLKIPSNSPVGALISRVREGTPAGRSGLFRGEIVTHVDGVSIRSAREFYDILARSTTGQKLELSTLYEGETRVVSAISEEIPSNRIDEIGTELLGLELALAPKGGFVVSGVREGSGAHRIGFEAGDHIIGINGKPLNNEEDLQRSFLDLRGRSRALVVVRRGHGRYHLTVPMG